MSARIAAVALLVAALPACELTVQVTTSLDESGGGTFRLAMILDKELRRQLEATEGAASEGLNDVEQLFSRLHTAGWSTERSEPDGGLVMAATRRFTDPEDFDRALGELGSSSSGGDFGPLGPRFGVRTQRSFLKSTSRFEGSMDLSGIGALDPQVRELLPLVAESVTFEVRAKLPGSTGEITGGGVTEGEYVVWRPKLGQTSTFGAASSAIRVGSLLLIFIPGLVVLGALLWLALGRRRTDEAPGAIIPDEPAIIPDGAPEPAEPAEPDLSAEEPTP